MDVKDGTTTFSFIDFHRDRMKWEGESAGYGLFNLLDDNMDVETCEALTSNGEIVDECIKDGMSKQPDDSAESKADNAGSSDVILKNSSITNGCPDTSAMGEEVDAAKSVNGTSDASAMDEGRLTDKPSSEGDVVSVAEDSSKGNSEGLECGDSQQDSTPDEDTERTEPSEPSEDFQLPDGKGSDSVKSKETNSEDSTPSSTPRRTLKKKSKKVSKLSIMHAIAERLSGQAKGDFKGATRTEPKGDGESNASDSTSEAMDERLPQDSKDFSEADQKPASPAKESGSSKKPGNTCAVCSAVKGLRYQVLYQGKTQFLCSDVCFKTFRSKQKLAPKKPAERDRCAVCQKEHTDCTGYYSSFGPCKPLCSADCLEKHQKLQRPKRICAQCQQCVEATEQKPTFLVWETMEFCAEECLRKYQSANGSHCSHCRSTVNQLSLGKYCVRFGADIRQFCSGKCLEEFKRGLKVCCLCQKDLTKQVEGFLAPVGEKGHFKDFCSQECLERYERMNAFNAGNLVAHKCSACSTESTTKYQVDYSDASHRLCSDACVSKFRYANKIKMVVCENCHKLYDNTDDKSSSLYYDNVCLQFCTKACVNLFVLSHRKIVPCAWCKVKKYNFDMIERVESATTSHLFCSLNCVNLFRVNQNASSSRIIRCDFCFKMLPAQYHLTMSDASIRNFCCYKCVITFQNQFKNLPLLTTTSPTVAQPTVGKSQTTTETGSTTTPVITNIRSLAPVPVVPTSMQAASEISTSAANAVRTPPALTAMPKVVSASVLTPSNSSTDASPKVVTRAPSIAVSTTATSVTLPVPVVTTTNTLALTVPSTKDATTVAAGQSEREVIIQLPFPKLLRNKSVLCRPQMVTKAAFCRPVPCHKEIQTDMQTQTGSEGGPARLIPVPVPIYVPAPMHMFSYAVPSPLPIPIPVPVPIFLPTTKDTTEQILETLKEFREQMKNDKFDEVLLAIARSMAESSMKPSSESKASDEPSCGKPEKRAASDEADVDLSNKKMRTSEDEMETSDCIPVTAEAVKTHESLDSAAAVKAWQDWVQKKNAELEKSSLSGKRQLKLFKTNLLGMTPEELNYALCLFIKEVRLRDGTTPSPCCIYLQCLGIQQYLHEQGRQDNIFADPQYEMFTGCFHGIFSQAHDLSGHSREHIREEVLWQAKQLGDHSPVVLLNTLMYFNVKYFRLHTVDQHLQLSLADVSEQEQETPEGQPVKILRSTAVCQEEGSEHRYFDQPQNLENPQRCPVKLYELYLSKCPDTVKSQQGTYYMLPERTCNAESAVWYSCSPLGKDTISRMLTRFSIVEEVKDVSSKLICPA
ncbi:zinc finger protein without children isoform X1 [Dermacentor variabilis]|uniref:zinc finger protein without children isoform X1 n=2 Tax=Dermacentor variabilis TaxID=34621 RepID=UPI003F5ADE47